MTRIWAGHSRIHVSIPDMNKRFISSSKRPDRLNSGGVQWMQRVFPEGETVGRLRLIAYAPPVPWLKTRAIPHSPTRLPIINKENVTFTLFHYLLPGNTGSPDWRLLQFSSNVTDYEWYLKMGHHGFLKNPSVIITCYFLSLRTHIHTRPRHYVVKINIFVLHGGNDQVSDSHKNRWNGHPYSLSEEDKQENVKMMYFDRITQKMLWTEMVNCTLTANCPQATLEFFFSWHVW
jgi:hypothetical protein